VAQIVPDATLGSEASVVNLGAEVNQRLIEGGAARGNALFHSFEQFNVGSGERVDFANPNGITEILGRVTGSDVSDILGTLGVDGGASLFLLNPNGIVFGPDARLDISGSFTASTAERFIFADGAEFSAVHPQVAPLLTVNHVNPRLGYGVNEATMIVAGELVVGEDLRLGAHRLEIGGELQARRDMVLQGSERILSGGNYTVGGYLFTQDLAGNGVDFVVPHSNVIWADGDVSLNGDYTGQSLYVLAGGSVSVGAGVDEIGITGGTVESVSPMVSDGMGGTQTITVSSDGQARLDIRSGVDWDHLGGDPGSSAPKDLVGVTFGEATSGDIDLTGVDIRNSGGDVVLMSQVEAGSSLGQGDIVVKGIDTSMEEGDGGNITLSTITGDIFTGQLDSYSYSYSGSLISGEGGNVGLSTVTGDITTGVLNSWSFSAVSPSSSASGTFVGEAGGDIRLSTVTGHISTETLDSSFTLLRPLSGDGAVGADGGNIVLSTITGHISIGSLNSSSFTGSTTDVEAGDGGGIALSTRTGNISTRSLDSPSFSGSFSNDVVARDGRNDILGIISYLAPDEGPSQNRRTILITTLLDDIAAASSGSLSFAPSGDVVSGDGGDINFSTITGNISTGDLDASSDSRSYSYSISGNVIGGDAGNVAFSTISGNITTDGLNTSAESRSIAGLNSGDIVMGDGGNISVSTITGDISTGGIYSYSESGSSPGNVIGGNGGNIFVSTQNDIDIQGAVGSLSIAGSGTAGSGGNIELRAQGHILITGELGGRFALASFSNIEASGNAGRAGNIIVEAQGDINIGTHFNSNSPEFVHNPVWGGVNTSSQARNGTADVSGNIIIATKEGDLNIFGGAFSNSTADVNLGDSTDSGNILLRAPNGTLSVLGNQIGVIVTTSSVDDLNSSSGDAGTIELDAFDINLTAIPGSNSGLNTRSTTTGSAGNISLRSQAPLNLNNLEIASNIRGNENTDTSGNIELFAPSITLSNTDLIATTSASGQSGRILIQADDTIVLNNDTQILTRADAGATGNGGEIVVTGETLTINDSAIDASTLGSGNAGAININTSSLITSSGSEITTLTASEGNAGTITVTTPALTLTNGVEISASTSGSGNAGNINLNLQNLTLQDNTTISSTTTGNGNAGSINLNAPQSVELGQDTRLLVETTAAGNPGNIIVTTPSLTLEEDAQLSATVTATATNTSGGGNITLNSSNLDISGRLGIFAETASTAPLET
jgi:filamentous hemagglutinin family protein